MIREFTDPAAFRASVEQRLRTHALQAGVPALVVRRQAALERLMARLAVVAPGRWALKGGLALETRLHGKARASMDMDIDHALGADAARADLATATATDVGDYFAFAITESRKFSAGDGGQAVSFRIECAVAGILFEILQVDVTIAPPEMWDVQLVQRPGLLASLGLGPIDVLLISLEQQVAEKLHAYTRTYGKGKASTRPRDLVDLVLVRLYESVDAKKLQITIEKIFALRKTHQIPAQVPPPPSGWQISYRTEAEPLGIPIALADAHSLVATWLNPVLAGTERGRWDPVRSAWA